MSWYRTGTIAVTNGNATVAGTGTAFIANVRAGDALHAPDGNLYEITGFASDTSLSITPAYLGATQTGQSYAIQPTRGVTADLLAALQSNNADVSTMLGGPGAGKFADGTLAQPGVRFTVDEDTGLRRVGSNKGALVAGGKDVLTFEDAVPGGTMVQSSTTDATSGLLMIAGAFGLGNVGTAPEMPDLDATDTPSVIYYYSSGTTTNVASRPASAAGTGTVLLARAFSNTCIQILTENLAAGTGGESWYRTYNATYGAWSGWRLYYTPENILGTVSQTSGVPTGAIVERGSNANGEYVRFADGTQFCTGTGSLTFVNGSLLQTAWTYPAAFSNAGLIKPLLSLNASNLAATPALTEITAAVGASIAATSMNVQVRIISGMTAFVTGDTAEVRTAAVGTWF